MGTVYILSSYKFSEVKETPCRYNGDINKWPLFYCLLTHQNVFLTFFSITIDTILPTTLFENSSIGRRQLQDNSWNPI